MEESPKKAGGGNRMPLVQNEIQRLTNAITRVEELAKTFGERLGPVFGPDRPPDDKDKAEKDRTELPRIAENIQKETDRIDALSGVADAFLQRLEI